MSYESDEDTDDDTLSYYRHVFLCYKTLEAWPWRIKGYESDPLPKIFASALKARKNDITFKTSLTVIEGREGTEFSDGDVLIFPQMIKYRGLKESDVDSFVDDVLVNDRPWASGVQEPLTGPHVFVTACFHLEGHNYARIFTPYDRDGSMTYHWYPFVNPGYVPELLDEHIGKGEIIERHWRGQMGASSNEAEEINDRELPNGEENKKIEDKPQENGNQIHQEKGNHIENNENFSGYCQGANSEGFTYCKKVSLEEDGGSEDKKPKETTESCVRKDALQKLSSLIGNWEQSDVLAAAVVVGAVATVAVAYSFYRRSG
ncbi:hypothetical protein ACFX2A_045909 [Malus domestica]